MTSYSSQTSLIPVHSLLLLGPTGVGKTPLGNALANHGLFGRRCHHLDFGSELRNVSNKRPHDCYTAEELTFIDAVLERGLLLENEHFHLADKIIARYLKRVNFSSRDILILNGIPRHIGQADDMAVRAHIHALIVLDSSAEVVFNRISQNSGGDRSGRIDDTRDMIEKKLLLFKQRTTPLIEYYETRDRPLYRVCVTDTMTTEDTSRAVLSLASANPPITLIIEPPKR